MEPARLINDWRVMLCPHRPFQAPEAQDHFHLLGRIGNKTKLTSRVVSTVGRLVTTKSGSVYRLGRIQPEYREWIAKRGLKYDARQPVKVETPCDPKWKE